jgi:hypothetical protein
MIIPLPDPLPPTPAQRSALSILAQVNSAAGQAVERHQKLYTAFWDAEAAPDEILAEMGKHAATMLAAAAESARHLSSLAAIAGLKLDDIISPAFIEPRRAFQVNADGTATLAPPADGHDAWGKPIPQPEPDTVIEE